MNWIDFFPFAPRPFQARFIDDMALAVARDDTSVFMAPNGFGKTVCTLSFSAATTFDRIYYATRTHKQLENVIKTARLVNVKAGRPVLPSIELAGKERSCINQSMTVNFSNVLSTCSSSRNGNKCLFGNDPSSWLDVPAPGSAIAIDLAPVMSAADVKMMSIKHGMCPYYMSTIIHRRFKLVACSYNHVFDPVVRKSIGISLANSLVICDEAHNIIDAMESYLTRELTSTMIQEAFRSPVRYSPESVEILHELGTLLSRADAFFKENGKTHARIDDIVAFMESRGITKKWMARAAKLLKDDDEAGFTDDIVSFLNVMRGESEKMAYYHSSKNGPERTRSLRVSSMDVKQIIDEMIESGAKILFVSGTISPGFFKSRAGMPGMPVHEYVLPERNLEVYIMDTVPSSRRKLSSHVHARDDPDVMEGFAACIAPVLPVVPGGSLVFFPSYKMRDDALKAWERAGYIDYNDDLDRCFDCNKDGSVLIPLHVERKEDKDKRVINEFKAVTRNGTPAVLLSVFRGGASEGEDFPGNECRCVACIGVPMRNVTSGEVAFKMEHYDKVRPGLGTFWLRWDAMMAISQAVGRGIRDPVNDKAIAILVDTRFNKEPYKSLLSRWIDERVVLSGPGISPGKVRDRALAFFR